MSGKGVLPSEYGDRHAEVYDRIYGSRFALREAVDALARAASRSPVLELGLGTGRLALPLVRHGVRVDGIEASPAMIARLRAQPGADSIGVFTPPMRSAAATTPPPRPSTSATCSLGAPAPVPAM